MKIKKLFIVLLGIGGTLLYSCKNEKSSFEPVENSAKVEWTAYKTTEKLPVKGTFESVDLINLSEGKSIEDFLNNAEFSIRALELSTGDPSRDEKIKNSFFGLMNEAGKISGKFIFENHQWTINLRMNGVSVNNIPAEIQFKDNLLSVKSSIDLKDFKALKALEVLNSVCFDLHKGVDGISKVWENVDIHASVKLKETKK